MYTKCVLIILSNILIYACVLKLMRIYIYIYIYIDMYIDIWNEFTSYEYIYIKSKYEILDIYTYMYVYICTSVCVYVCVYIYIYIYIYIYK